MRVHCLVTLCFCGFILLACTSPQGSTESYILYTTSEGLAGGQIRLLEPDGSMDRLLVEIKDLSITFPPSVSPDGTRILYTIWLSAGDRAEFWTMNLDDSGQTPIFEGQEPRYPEWPSWSGDSTRVAFTTRWDKNRSVCGREFYVVDLATTNLTKLPVSGWHYQWSPVDSRMAVLCAYGEMDGMYIIDVDTMEKKKLLPGVEPEIGYAWSPDGRSIALAYNRPSQGEPGVEIGLLDVESGDLRKIARGRGGLSWSPEGDKILFFGVDYSLFVLDLRAGKTTQLVAQARSISDLAWSPDGKEIAFISREDPARYGQIYKLRLATGEITQLTDDPNPKFSLSWVVVPGINLR